jgi:hypothetical protein
MAEPSFETGVSEDAAGAGDIDGEPLEWADVDRVTVRATDFQLVPRLHPSLVWIKIMFIVMQYLSRVVRLCPKQGDFAEKKKAL